MTRGLVFWWEQRANAWLPWSSLTCVLHCIETFLTFTVLQHGELSHSSKSTRNDSLDRLTLSLQLQKFLYTERTGTNCAWAIRWCEDYHLTKALSCLHLFQKNMTDRSYTWNWSYPWILARLSCWGPEGGGDVEYAIYNNQYIVRCSWSDTHELCMQAVLIWVL